MTPIKWRHCMRSKYNTNLLNNRFASEKNGWINYEKKLSLKTSQQSLSSFIRLNFVWFEFCQMISSLKLTFLLLLTLSQFYDLVAMHFLFILVNDKRIKNDWGEKKTRNLLSHIDIRLWFKIYDYWLCMF